MAKRLNLLYNMCRRLNSGAMRKTYKQFLEILSRHHQKPDTIDVVRQIYPGIDEFNVLM